MPPVTSLATWRTGHAFCDAWYLNSNGLTSAGVHVTPPSLDELPMGPGNGWMAFHWQAGITWWDPARNQWIQDQPTPLQSSNPIDAFDYLLGPYIPSLVLPIVRHRVYSYVWVQAWWHYTATRDEASFMTGGTWYTGSHYLSQVGSSMSNGGCWWG